MLAALLLAAATGLHLAARKMKPVGM
jgi:hypothetical protein